MGMQLVPKWEDWLSNQSLSQSSLSSDIHSPPPSSEANNDLVRHGRGSHREVLGPRKTGKRKPPAANKKRSRMPPTTYVQVDPENFRAMVQWMTGPPRLLINPEPRKPVFSADRVGNDGVPVEKENEFDVDCFFNFPTLESGDVMVEFL